MLNDSESNYLALLLLILFVLAVVWSLPVKAEIPADKMQKLSVCWMVGEAASAVQQIRHEGDTLPMFRARAPQALRGMDEMLVNKYMQIGEDVYQNMDIGMSRSSVLVVYYTDCINNFETMAAEANGWF